MIIRLAIGILILFLLYKLLRKGASLAGRRSGKAAPPAAAGEDLVEDPHCHTYVPLSHACRASHGGKTVYFCSRKCLEEYEREKKEDT